MNTFLLYCSFVLKVFYTYSETRLTRTPRGHTIVSILSGCPFLLRGNVRNTCLPKQTVFTIIYHSVRVKFFEYCIVIETGTAMDSFYSPVKICHSLNRVQILQLSHNCDHENRQCADNQCP